MIYIVEDDVDIRELESYALKNSGYEVVAFGESTELYQACENSIPSLILLDIMLPKEDGLSILKKIRANEKMQKFNAANQLYSGMVNKVYAILELCCNGEDPDTCEPEEHSCSGSCSTCGGCH